MKKLMSSPDVAKTWEFESRILQTGASKVARNPVGQSIGNNKSSLTRPAVTPSLTSRMIGPSYRTPAQPVMPEVGSGNERPVSSGVPIELGVGTVGVVLTVGVAGTGAAHPPVANTIAAAVTSTENRAVSANLSN